MCGIGGQIILNKKKGFTKEQKLNAISLLISLQDRGKEAWGMYLEKTKENEHLYCEKPSDDIIGELFKTQSSPTTFFKDGNIIYFDDVHTFLVHTRTPTTGPVSYIENNHPFNTKNFILAHNGAIYNYDEVKREYKINTKIECDSYPLVAMVQYFYDKGKTVAEAITEMSKVIRGSYACWLYHKDTKDLYLFKNNNPLSYYLDNENGVFIFASEEDNILDAYSTDEMKDKIKSLDVDVIYKLTNDSLERVGKLESKSDVSHNRIDIASRSHFDTATINNTTDSFEYMFELLEKYESKEDDQTVLIITAKGEVQILVKPVELLSILDNSGFKEFKSKGVLYESEYYEYLIDKIETFNEAVIKLKAYIDKKDEVEEEEDVTSSNLSKDSLQYVSALNDLAEMIGCDLKMSTKCLTFINIRKDKEIETGIKKLFKKVGFIFSKKGILEIDNSAYHEKNLKVILGKLQLYDYKETKSEAIIGPLILDNPEEES